MTARAAGVLGAVFGFLAVALGAFGAHALRTRVTAELAVAFETGARYQMYHALALLACAWVLERWGSSQAAWAAWLFVAGIVVFCGSLYALTATGERWWGALAPVGGVAFLAGWACLAWALLAAK